MSKMFKIVQYTNVLIQMFGVCVFITTANSNTGSGYESAINSFTIMILTGIFSIAGVLMGALYFIKYRKHQCHALMHRNNIISSFHLIISFAIIGIFLFYIPRIII